MKLNFQVHMSLLFAIEATGVGAFRLVSASAGAKHDIRMLEARFAPRSEISLPKFDRESG